MLTPSFLYLWHNENLHTSTLMDNAYSSKKYRCERTVECTQLQYCSWNFLFVWKKLRFLSLVRFYLCSFPLIWQFLPCPGNDFSDDTQEEPFIRVSFTVQAIGVERRVGMGGVRWGQGSEVPQSKMRWGRSMLIQKGFMNKNPLFVPSVKNVENLQFSLTLHNMLH